MQRDHAAAAGSFRYDGLADSPTAHARIASTARSEWARRRCRRSRTLRRSSGQTIRPQLTLAG